MTRTDFPTSTSPSSTSPSSTSIVSPASSSTATTMLAIVQQRDGAPDVLTPTILPRPIPRPTEVLVRVTAAGVNPVDWKTRAGGGISGMLDAPPRVLGWDVAGVVEEIGFGVTTLTPGDRVFGMPRFPQPAGGYAELVTAPSRQLARIPDGVSDVEAAAVPLAGLTAWQALVDTAHVRSGARVLVTAAAGGVGHLAVQLAHHLGAHVVAVAAGRHASWLRAIGADEVVDRDVTRFDEVVRDVDVVVDLLGDDVDGTSTRSLSTLRPGGLLVAVPSGVSPTLAAAADAAGVRATPILVEPDGTALARLASLLADGSVRVEVAAVLPLSAAAEAHALGETGRTRGKIVLRVDRS